MIAKTSPPSVIARGCELFPIRRTMSDVCACSSWTVIVVTGKVCPLLDESSSDGAFDPRTPAVYPFAFFASTVFTQGDTCLPRSSMAFISFSCGREAGLIWKVMREMPPST